MSSEAKPRAIFTERPSAGEYVAPVIMCTAALGALTLSTLMANSSSAGERAAGLAVEAIGATASYVSSFRILEKMQHELWIRSAEAGRGLDPLNYRFFGAQFIPESQLTEDIIDPLVSRVYVVPAATVRPAES